MNNTTYETTPTEDMINAELRLGTGMEEQVVLTPLFPPRAWPAAEIVMPAPRVVAPAPRSRVLSRLLAMADSYVRAGSLRQAMEMYFELYNSHTDTPEASLAEKRILEVARRHEEDGELHSARAIYEQLI